jgi:hypothetical protein
MTSAWKFSFVISIGSIIALAPPRRFWYNNTT